MWKGLFAALIPNLSIIDLNHTFLPRAIMVDMANMSILPTDVFLLINESLYPLEVFSSSQNNNGDWRVVAETDRNDMLAVQLACRGW